jgi:hypothetical protein
MEDAMDERTCTTCGKTKPLSDYYKRSGRDLYYRQCKMCHNARTSQNLAAARIDPERRDRYRATQQAATARYRARLPERADYDGSARVRRYRTDPEYRARIQAAERERQRRRRAAAKDQA